MLLKFVSYLELISAYCCSQDWRKKNRDIGKKALKFLKYFNLENIYLDLKMSDGKAVNRTTVMRGLYNAQQNRSTVVCAQFLLLNCVTDS